MRNIRKKGMPCQDAVFFAVFGVSWATMRTLVTCLLVVLTAGSLPGQQDSCSRRAPWYEVIVHDAVTMVRGGIAVGTAPLRWQGEDWVTAGGVAAATGLSAALDRSALRLMDNNRSATADGLQRVVVLYGEEWVLASLVGGAYGAGLAAGADWLRETALLAGGTLVLTSGLTQLLKAVVGRARPYLAGDPARFSLFTFRYDYHSFPSGHAVASFSVSAVLAARLKNPWATAGLYSLAALTSVSRVYSRDHWFSDIVFGALFSTAVAHSLVRWYERETTASADGGFSWNVGPGGVSVAYTF